MNKKYYKKGISLIVLVITIIIIIIIAGAVILSLANNNPIAQATEAVFKADIDAYSSELAMNISSRYASNSAYDPTKIYATAWDGSVNISGTVKEYINSISVEDGKNFIIENGKLAYIGNDTNMKKWAKETGYDAPYVKDGLVLWLYGNDFKNSPATTTWVDKSGNGNDAIVNGFSYTATSGSNGQGGVAFDGIDDNVCINKSTIFKQTSMTVELYIIPHNQNKRHCLFTYWYGFTTEINSDGTFKFGLNGLSNQYYGTKKVVWDKPIHIVSTYDDTTKTQRVYFDGVFQEEQVTTGQINYDTTSGYFSGVWDRAKVDLISCRFYNRALTASEVLQNYNSRLY